MTWPAAVPLATYRLDLEPLSVAHAEEMVSVLGDPALHAVIGGRPPTLAELRERYRRQTGAADDGSQAWLNWVVRRRDTGAAAGYVQATVHAAGTDLAWVVGTAHQRLGIASEAAVAVVTWLTDNGVEVLSAYVAQGHSASEAVARRVGLRPSDETLDGEVRWVRRVSRAR
jgi:RimJ/RimL family protein N-acetyltransferase